MACYHQATQQPVGMSSLSTVSQAGSLYHLPQADCITNSTSQVEPWQKTAMITQQGSLHRLLQTADAVIHVELLTPVVLLCWWSVCPCTSCRA